jgi:hemoglobin-like flavoprotein
MSATLSAEQIGLIRTSFDAVASQADAVAARFYARLFSERPDLRPLFRIPIEVQSRKLMSALAAVIASLEHLDVIAPALQEMGERHAAYGVMDRDYGDLGTVLLWTLEAGLGSAFGAEVRKAWGDAYGLVADTMKTGAARQRRAS